MNGPLCNRFYPSSNLAWSTTYTATITTGVKDLAGNSLKLKKGEPPSSCSPVFLLS
ncbi:MAG: Ig-like domain-containing protein [Candidatus Krumholzibacteria bacterium]|nr:Ig-like domain-containing protein [Candidatus Krumholzibacteria bacterium]